MSSEGSISFWIEQLKAGTPEAAQSLWNHYFNRLVYLARQRLEGVSRAVADEEDVALSAFKSFCLAAEHGRFPNLQDRDDLWKLLTVIAERKAFNLRRDQRRLKRGGPIFDTIPKSDDSSSDAPVNLLPGQEPTPLFAAIMAEECTHLLGRLPQDVLRLIALDKMEGFGNEEIATRRGLAVRTVERKLALIRRIWKEADEAQ